MALAESAGPNVYQHRDTLSLHAPPETKKPETVVFQVPFVVWGAADAPKGGTGSRIFSPFPPRADTAPFYQDIDSLIQSREPLNTPKRKNLKQ